MTYAGTRDSAQDYKVNEDSSTSGKGSGSLMRIRGAGSSPSQSNNQGSTTGTGSSATTMQYSCRDWGWFDEDVHYGSEQNLFLKALPTTTNGQQKRTSYISDSAMDTHDYNQNGEHKFNLDTKRPLLAPRTSSSEQDTASGAKVVTAPTYVLEESLSSQRLWKDTAGQRPPQPVEERAFYEKLWAQNFERSKVKYALPPELLTATSPVCLSAFADNNGIFENATSGNHHGPTDVLDYSIYTQLPPGGDNGGVPTVGSPYMGGGAAGGNDPIPGPGDAAAMMMLPWWNFHQLNKKKDSGVWEPNLHQHIVNKTVKDTNDGTLLTVLVRGDNVFGTTVSKSFASGPMVGVMDSVNVSIASYRVVESKKHGKYAQFLVIYREGSIGDLVGVWKRYSDFCQLSKKVFQSHERCSTAGCVNVIASISPPQQTTTGAFVTGENSNDNNNDDRAGMARFPNSITSWRLLKKRQRWYRCLDAGYLSLKVFLLERFLHDILFESSSPKMLREFVGADSLEAFKKF